MFGFSIESLLMSLDFFNEVKDMCVGFGRKYATFGEWLHAGTNLKVYNYVKWECPVKRVTNTGGNGFSTSCA